MVDDSNADLSHFVARTVNGKANYLNYMSEKEQYNTRTATLLLKKATITAKQLIQMESIQEAIEEINAKAKINDRLIKLADGAISANLILAIIIIFVVQVILKKLIVILW